MNAIASGSRTAGQICHHFALLHATCTVGIDEFHIRVICDTDVAYMLATCLLAKVEVAQI
jgi:hypothetical protein